MAGPESQKIRIRWPGPTRLIHFSPGPSRPGHVVFYYQIERKSGSAETVGAGGLGWTMHSGFAATRSFKLGGCAWRHKGMSDRYCGFSGGETSNANNVKVIKEKWNAKTSILLTFIVFFAARIQAGALTHAFHSLLPTLSL